MQETRSRYAISRIPLTAARSFSPEGSAASCHDTYNNLDRYHNLHGGAGSRQFGNPDQ